MPDNRAASPGAVGENSSGHSVDISVILCTFNRCRSLAKALESVVAQSLPPSFEWEVLVVDNNSKDQTREVVKDFCLRYPGRIRYLFEPQPGKSFALNSGIHQARGAILAFVDDDVTVDSTWLRNLTAELSSGEWAGAGGPILPEQAVSLPRWLPVEEPRILRALALFNLGADPGPIAESPLGTNMAFRKDAFERYGLFRTDLGPRPGGEIRGEDTEFGSRILAVGARIRYEPSAVVYHAMPQNRLTKGYFLTWWFDKGRSDFREFGIPPGTRWSVGGTPLYLFRRLAVWTLRWLVSIRPSRRFYRQIQVRWLAGQILESRRQRQPRPVEGNVT